jgi:hypothetical protein
LGERDVAVDEAKRRPAVAGRQAEAGGELVDD